MSNSIAHNHIREFQYRDLEFSRMYSGNSTIPNQPSINKFKYLRKWKQRKLQVFSLLIQVF